MRHLRVLPLLVAFMAPAVAAQPVVRWEARGQVPGAARTMAALPNGTLLAGGNGLFWSTDGGLTWTETETQDASHAHVAIRLLARANGDAYAAGAYGVFRSGDGGVTWTKVVHAPWTHHQCDLNAWWGVLAEAPGVVLTGGIASGAPAYPFAGRSPVVSGSEGCGYFGYLARSPNGGAPWTSSQTPHIYHLVVEPSTGAYYGAGGSGAVSRSMDDGATWSPVTALPRGPYSVLTAPAPGVLFAGLIAERLPLHASWLVWAYPNAATGSGLYRSTDGGITWERVGADMLGPGTRALVADPFGRTIVSTDAGLFASDDFGTTWALAMEGLPASPVVHALALATDGHAYAVALDGWVYRTHNAVVASEPTGGVPDALTLTAAPNPAAGAAVLRFTLPAAGSARLAVYDALGREVAVLADRVHAAGLHEVRWAGEGLPGGVYLLRLTTPAGVRTQRVTLTR